MDGQHFPEGDLQKGTTQVLLYGEVTQVPGPSGRYALTLTPTELHLQQIQPAPESRGYVLSLADCIGCCSFKGKDPTDLGAYFSVFCYPVKKKWWRSRAARQREAKTFRLEPCRDLEENLKTAERWATKIRELSAQRLPEEKEGLYSCLPQARQLLVLVNPFGGKGQAQHLFYSHVLPMLTEADIGFNLVVTERQNQARELVKDEDLSRWDAVVTVSGDGLLYEVINGLMERSDWQSAIKKPLGILPGGSGNALAMSINHYTGNDPVNSQDLLTSSTFTLCKGLVAPMDLVSITTASGKHLFSFLSFAWGFISDVDIESEKHRTMGPARFTLGTLIRLCSLRTYKGRLSYLPAAEASGEVSSFTSSQISQNCQYNVCNSNNSYNPQSNANEVDHTSTASVAEVSRVVPLDQPVPNHWTIVKEEDFVLVLAIYQPYLGEDFFMAPMVSKPDDNLIHLFYVKAGISRASLLKYFLAVEKGNHLQQSSPHVVYVPIKAFRIEPFTSKGVMTVDGEALECGQVQGQLHSRLARIISGTKLQ
ncbi:sphingosine kinase 1 [Microcaecilia unicolor]|uniref:sphingosine kinase n=1 Tax=Microcaecilia unicolor TaxID=1415580 RepID=A0A6P7Y998_9AMPH|nr:sphingosine kinase 1 [Microcaecilia unicolor]